MFPYEILPGFDLYTICITLGMAGCLVLFRLLADRAGLSARLTNLTLACGLCGAAAGLGTAVLFQAFYRYLDGGSFALSGQTGATFYGGLLGGAAVFLLVYFLPGRILFPDGEHRAQFFAVSGMVAPAITFAHAAGRLGCFFVGCCYGVESGTPLDLYFPALGRAVLPTQLYEAVFLAALTVFLILRARRGYADGLPLYLLAYAVFRYLLEFVRGDDRGATLLPFFSPSQLTALLLFAVGGLLLLFARRLRRGGGCDAG